MIREDRRKHSMSPCHLKRGAHSTGPFSPDSCVVPLGGKLLDVLKNTAMPKRDTKRESLLLSYLEGSGTGTGAGQNGPCVPWVAWIITPPFKPMFKISFLPNEEDTNVKRRVFGNISKRRSVPTPPCLGNAAIPFSGSSSRVLPVQRVCCSSYAPCGGWAVVLGTKTDAGFFVRT